MKMYIFLLFKNIDDSLASYVIVFGVGTTKTLQLRSTLLGGIEFNFEEMNAASTTLCPSGELPGKKEHLWLYFTLL